MKKIKLFEEFVSEVSKQMISGTSGRTITTLDNRKYELKKDVKDARIGDYINVVLPKGTIINNLPGGVFANHKDLKDKYCTGYKAQRWDDKFGVAIRTMPDTLEAIEDNSKVLESMVSEVVELVHVYDTKGELQGTGELVKTKGNKSLIRWDGSSEEWIDSKLVKLVESTINEDAASTFLILMQSAMVMGQLALLGNKISAGGGTTPIEDLKNWWQKRKSDKAVKSIIDKIKDDKDIVEFMKLTPSQQRGKFRSLVATKLNDEELNYLNKINRNHFQTESLDENFPGPGETVDAKDLDYDMLDYFSRTNKVLSIDTKSKKGIKGSVGKMYNDLVFNGDSIAKKDIVRVKILEGTYNNDREIAIYDGEDGLTYIEKRGKGYYGHNDEFDFEAENKAELEKKLKSWKYKLISGSIDESIVNEHSLQESKRLNEANEYNREELMNLMETKYKIKTVRTTEEFSGEEGGIWIAGDNGEELSNGKIFDYYNRSSKYKNGVLKNVVDVVEKKGWWFSWNDPGTIMIWPKN